IQKLNPISLLGLPHVATEDDIHNDFFVPKGAIVITNNWRLIVFPRHRLFYRDANTWADPEIFRPERFVETANSTKKKDP
ncbi:hypothetical protein B0H16DRAFT_1236451, partial [Mycena metata]